MKERKPSFIQRQVDGIVDGLIVMRQSGEPFFGVQTVFAPLIDRLIKKREVQKLKEPQPSEKNQPNTIV